MPALSICPRQDIAPHDEDSRLFNKSWWLYFYNIGERLSAISPTGPYIDPTSIQYGAIGDGVTDDSTAWTAAIAAAVSSGLPIFGGGRTYRVSKQGTYTLPWDGGTHSYVFRVTNPIVVTDSVFTMSITDATKASIFVFQSTSGVRINRVSAVGTGTAATLLTYDGALLVFDRCTDCQASEILTENMRGNTLFFQGSNCEVSRSFSGIPGVNLAGAHFASYGCSSVTIRDCTCYGGCHDGDCYHFGENSATDLGTGNRTLGCHIHNYQFGDATRTIVYNEAQGYLLDSGQNFGSVCDCYAYGYFYGIDVKTTCTGSLVQGNTVEKCKVGIAVRRGEGNAPIYNAQVLGNIIRPMDGNGNTENLFLSLTDTAGIWLQDARGVVVADNLIEASWLFGSGEQDYIGLFGVTTAASPPNVAANEGFLITGNKFVNEMDVGGFFTFTKNASVYLIGRSDNLLVRGKLDGNVFKTYTGGNATLNTVTVQQCSQFSISRNHFGRILGDYQAVIVTAATQLQVSDNTFAGAAGFISIVNSDIITIQGNQFGICGRNLSTALPVPVIYGASVSHVVVEGNIQTQTINGHAGLDDGRFVETSASGNIDIVIANNVMEKLIFVADWYQINSVSLSAAAGIAVFGNIVNGIAQPSTVVGGTAGQVLTSNGAGTYPTFQAGSGSTLPVADTTAIVKGSSDATKLVRIEADGLTTATTRVATMPDRDITLNKSETLNAAASSSLTLSTSMADIPGDTVTLNKTGTWLILANVTFTADAVSAGIAAQLVIGGSQYGASMQSDVIGTYSLSFSWLYSNSGSNVAKMQAKKNAGAGTSTAYSGSSDIIAIFLG